jgi:hypothetical protein
MSYTTPHGVGLIPYSSAAAQGIEVETPQPDPREGEELEQIARVFNAFALKNAPVL